MSQPNSEEDREKRIQRALNEAKKKDFEKKYGMESYLNDPEIEPEVEGEFLDYVEEFERQYQSAKRTTVRELVESPERSLWLRCRRKNWTPSRMFPEKRKPPHPA